MENSIAMMPISQTKDVKSTKEATHRWQSNVKPYKPTMDTDDFLKLIMAQYQNQDMMNPASSDDFVNQMVQILTIQTMTTLNDISTIQYGASLVGKEVTLGDFSSGKLEEIVGVVTGSGMLNGQQVIFVNGKPYPLNSIMAVGRIPENPKPEEGEKPESVEGAQGGSSSTEKPAAVEQTAGLQIPEGTRSV